MRFHLLIGKIERSVAYRWHTVSGRWRQRDTPVLPLEREGSTMTAPPETPQDDRDSVVANERRAASSISPATRETALYLAMRWQARADDDEAQRKTTSWFPPP